jgi:hypothetical protein
MAQPCKATMAARVGLGHLLDNFKDSRQPSSAFVALSYVSPSSCGWMPPNFCSETINTPKQPYSKGGLEPPRKWAGPVRMGRLAQELFGPFWAHVSRAGFSCNCELLSSWLCGLLTSLSTWIVRRSCRPSLCIFHLSPQSFVPSHCGPWVIWSHVYLECWLVPGFMIFSQSAHWTSLRSAPFSA